MRLRFGPAQALGIFYIFFCNPPFWMMKLSISECECQQASYQQLMQTKGKNLLLKNNLRLNFGP